LTVLDTHAWVWFVSKPELLSTASRKAIDAAILKKAVFISSISAWEVALLVANKSLVLTIPVDDWITKSERLPFFQFLPMDNSIAIKSANLPNPLHKDPADRIVVATAITIGAPIVTKDEKLLKYPHVETIW
jgi:PIN domain nuclease of toxin-antitoxin system